MTKKYILTKDQIESTVTTSEYPPSSTAVKTVTDGKVNVSQGAAEAGKYLKVGVDGNVTTGTAVSDYPDLTNKPSINSVTIVGNQTGAQLGLVDAVAGKGLSTNDYTNAEKTKLAGIADGAEVNVNADWNAVSGDAQILNKPSIPSKTSDLINDSTYQTASQVSASISTHNESASAHTDIRTTVSGKQDTISQSNKLSADLVDDTGTTNKFTSDAEKAGWNGKVSDVTLNGTSVVSSNTAVLTTIDNVTTNSQYPLSAKQGKVLNERIDAISSIGRYLSHWNCETGLPTTEPTSLPYTYHTGDYYVISVVSASTNYKPNGAQYTGSASTTTTTEPVAVNDIWRYDGTNWQFELNHAPQGSSVTDVTVGGVTVVSGGIATIPTASASAEGTLSSIDWGTFNAKQDAIDSTHKLSADLVDDTTATNKFYHTHASTHASGGSDAITIAESQVTNLVSDLAGKQGTLTASTNVTLSGNTISVVGTDTATSGSTALMTSGGLFKRIQYGSSAPSSPNAGDVWIKTT